ncbi:hypothetical protein BRADI_2g23136v3 [Brachypodium distachyon]|uniref:C2H2-type domain-containing protein n=1 Tax=Brachypodium distachyon TaxID=15368 RepID=A0A2K2D9Z0_BRADI|nr:hypothetical protein BRADI_2g23136v3 [Brachypodium distachyon]
MAAPNGSTLNLCRSSASSCSRGRGFKCPYCSEVFSTHQALGGHMSKRTCIDEPHRYQLPPLPPTILPASPILGALPTWLAPNPYFWEEYRRGGRRPVEINFLGIPRSPDLVPANGNVSGT